MIGYKLSPKDCEDAYVLNGKLKYMHCFIKRI